MTDLPAIGTEWVHRETLTVVTVLAADDADGFVSCRVNGLASTGVCETALWHEEHVQNEPVSLEVLGRLGWTIHGRARLFLKGGHDDGLGNYLEWNESFGVNYFADDPWYIRSLAPLKTTADLLRLMRVFGLEATL